MTASPAKDEDQQPPLPLLTAREDNAGFALPNGLPAASASASQRRRRRRRRRLATLYDAVAGKVTKDHLARNDDDDDDDDDDNPPPSRAKPTHVIRYPTRGGPLGPDEVLFRRKDATQRYAEHDAYNAHDRDLPRGGRGILPDSDLLESVHAYASRFYAAMERRRRRHDSHVPPPPPPPPRRSSRGAGIDERSMDETALLAFGILLEEAGREILGRRGDCVFTEGVPAQHPAHQDSRSRSRTMGGDDGVVRARAGSAAGRQRSASTSSRGGRPAKRKEVVRSSGEL